MIKKRILPAVLSIIALNLIATNSLFAQPNPGAVFKECQSQLNLLALQCVSANEQSVEDCIPVIELLLDQENFEEAVVVATQCVDLIRLRTRQCRIGIGVICRNCVRVLNELGEPDLAILFRENCENTAQFVVFNTQMAVQAVQDLFGD